MKITKSELKEMIREALREELSTAHKVKLKEASLNNITAYITFVNYDGDTAFGT